MFFEEDELLKALINDEDVDSKTGGKNGIDIVHENYGIDRETSSDESKIKKNVKED